MTTDGCRVGKFLQVLKGGLERRGHWREYRVVKESLIIYHLDSDLSVSLFLSAAD